MAVLPRRPKGPPLNALRAFEAAARLDSFVAAAEELGVTAGAVSQHVKAVEAWSGTSLFERSAQGVSLSAAGRLLTEDFTRAFVYWQQQPKICAIWHPTPKFTSPHCLQSHSFGYRPVWVDCATCIPI